jgi:HEAT repeat-containing protein 5
MSIKGSGRSANEQLSKDLYKLAKNSLGDRIPLLRTAAFELLESVYKFTNYAPPLNLTEFESILFLCAKAVITKNSSLRNASASCIATLLSLSQQPSPSQRDNMKKDADQTLLSVDQMMSLLCISYFKAATLESKMSLIEGWAVFLRHAGIAFVENNYSLISNACFDLCSNLKFQKDKSETYAAKEAALFLMRDVVGKGISESGQLRACKDLVKELCSEKPLMEAKAAGILSVMTALLIDLGPAAYSVQDDILDPLLSLIGHPSQTVRLELAVTLREICLAVPHKITKIMNRLVITMQRELLQMTGEKPETVERVVGYGNILSSIIGIIASRSLFAAYEDAATIFGLATQLLKSHLNAKDYRVMASQAQIGWTLIGSLMTLGHNFVRVHVSQLLLVWKNVFPKTQPKDSLMNRSELEWHYLLVSRDSALAALESFINCNGNDLVSVDVAKRIMICLHNTLQFVSTLIGAYGPIDDKPATFFQTKLYERECRLKSRLFICFKLLSPVSVYETIFTPLVRSVVDAFALDPEKPDRFLATLGTKDGALFGTIGGKDTGALMVETIASTSLISGSVISVAEGSGAEEKGIFKKSVHDTHIASMENIMSRKEQTSFENDPHALYLTSKIEILGSNSGTETAVSKVQPATHASVALVDSAIELFSLIFPLQNAQTQETILEQLIKAATHHSGRITPIRKAACQINSLVAIIGALKYIAGKKGQLQSPKVSVAIRDLMTVFFY